MSNPETIANIVAEMRGLVKPGETLEHTYELLNGLADRIEAAHKREVESVSNGAKMREALKQILALAQAKAKGLFEIQSLAETALAAPPRNCDVGTAEEQYERFVNFARLYFQSEVVRFVINWAQMPYEEGGAKCPEVPTR